jgi:hypothetical protein
LAEFKGVQAKQGCVSCLKNGIPIIALATLIYISWYQQLAAAAEERRKNPPSKVVTIFYKKEKQHHATVANKPKLLSDQPLNDVISHYAVTFEETIILRVSDMQLSDQGKIYLKNRLLLCIHRCPTDAHSPHF